MVVAEVAGLPSHLQVKKVTQEGGRSKRRGRERERTAVCVRSCVYLRACKAMQGRHSDLAIAPPPLAASLQTLA